MHRSIVLLIGIGFTATAAHAQVRPATNGDPDIVQSGGVQVKDWKGRIDPQAEKRGANINQAKFVTMGAGMHVTAGPAAIYWNEANTASGNFSTSATFRQTKPSAHAEGYGLIVGGNNLTAPDQSYVYFLVRQDGKFLINHRANDSTVHKLVDWTENAAINKVPEGGTATNALRVEATATDVVFYVNDKEVQRLPRAQLNLNGIAGLRVNHNLDLHVAGFAVKRS